jgi:hypothetical protein
MSGHAFCPLSAALVTSVSHTVLSTMRRSISDILWTILRGAFVSRIARRAQALPGGECTSNRLETGVNLRLSNPTCNNQESEANRLDKAVERSAT